MNSFKRTLLVCWLGVFTTNMGLSQIAPILPLYLRELGLKDHADIAFFSGLGFGITPLFVAIFSPLWAFLATKYGYKSMLLRASLGMSISTFCLSFANSGVDVVIIRALMGVVAGFTSAAVVFIAVIFPKSKVAYALGTLSTASISGSLIGPLFGGIVAEFLSIRSVFYLIAFFIACSFITIYFFIDEKRILKKQEKSTGTIKQNIFLILTLFIATFFIQFGVSGTMPILTLLVEQIYQGEKIAFWAGIVVASSGISNLLFATKLGKIADKTGPSKIIFIALLFSGLMFYLQAIAHNVYMLILVRLFLGIGLGGLVPCINALLKKSINTKNLSLAFGINQSAYYLGNFSGSFGNGILAGKFGVQFVFLMICILFISNALLFLLLNKKRIFSNKDL
ncbi:MFS transporter [Campylobacter cuniculorum]|uniref:MFS transporter n=1 Tax=Campylobacter cuniculorum TaxID=374106 RepID=UPI0023F4322B|nr:MFS transporter [Campylobacter cuniculorum]